MFVRQASQIDWDFTCIRFPLYLKAFFPFYSLPSWPLTKVHQHHRISAILIIIVINITIFSLFSLCNSKTLYTVYDYCCHQHNWRKKEKKSNCYLIIYNRDTILLLLFNIANLLFYHQSKNKQKTREATKSGEKFID